MNKTKVLVIGLDGGTFDVINPLIKLNKLPTLKNLIENGVHGPLKSTILPITAPAWSSFLTGKNPGKHGVFDFVKKIEDNKFVTVNSTFINSKLIWEILNQYGKKSIIINVPLTHPHRKIDGVLISGLMTPPGKEYWFPEEIREILEKNKYKISMETFYNGNNKKECLEEINSILEARARVTLDLLTKKDWDFFTVVFSATDTASHFFWHTLSDGLAESPISKIYSRIDSVIADILDRIDLENTLVLIISDHGFGRLKGGIYINNFLIEKGYLKFKNNLWVLLKRSFFKVGLTLGFFSKLFGYGLGELVKKEAQSDAGLITKLKNIFFLSFNDVDWSKTKAYSRANFGNIFINQRLSGFNENLRKQIADELIQDLKYLKEPNSTDGLIENIFLREEIYSGPFMHHAPDILITSRNMEYIASREMDFYSKDLIGFPPRFMTGTHRMDGVFIVNGPSIKSNTKIENARIIDITPTILSLMNVPVPDDMDGKFIKEISVMSSP